MLPSFMFSLPCSATPTSGCRPNWNAAAAKQLSSCISCCRCQGSKVGTGLVGASFSSSFSSCSVCLCSLFVYKQMTRNPLGRVQLRSGAGKGPGGVIEVSARGFSSGCMPHITHTQCCAAFVARRSLLHAQFGAKNLGTHTQTHTHASS